MANLSGRAEKVAERGGVEKKSGAWKIEKYVTSLVVDENVEKLMKIEVRDLAGRFMKMLKN